MKRYNLCLLITVLVLGQTSFANLPRSKQAFLTRGLLATGLGLYGVYSGYNYMRNEYVLAKNWNQELELAKQKEAEKNARSLYARLMAFQQGLKVYSGLGQHHHYSNAQIGIMSMILSGAMTAYGINNIGKALRK